MHSNVLESLRPRPLYYMTHQQLAAADMPVGDPFGGPAYGEKRGPAVALIGAGFAIEAGIAIGATTLMGGLMIAGGVMSGLGALTGNKTLSTLGMVAGLGAGIGQFVNAGGFEAMSGAFESGGVGGVWDKFTGQTGGQGLSDVGGVDAMFGAGDAAPAVGGMTKSIQDQIISTGGFNPVMSNVADIGNAAAITGGDAMAATGGTNAGFGGTGIMGGTGNAAGSGGSGIMGDFFKSDVAKYGAIQAGGGLLKGLGESDAADKKLALDKSRLEIEKGVADKNVALADKKLAGVPMTSVGNFRTNDNAQVFGRNADGSPATREQYVNEWKSYYNTRGAAA